MAAAWVAYAVARWRLDARDPPVASGPSLKPPRLGSSHPLSAKCTNADAWDPGRAEDKGRQCHPGVDLCSVLPCPWLIGLVAVDLPDAKMG